MQPVGRLGRDHPDATVVAFEESTNPHQRAARSDAGDEVGDLAVRLVEDLRPRGVEVGAPVEGVVVLIRHEVHAGRRLLDPMRLADGTVRSLEGRRENRFRAERLDDLASLLVHIGRHHELHLVALRRSDQRISDAGVPRGRIEDHLLHRQLAGLLCLLDHAQRRPILHRAAGIEPLSLGVERDMRKLFLQQPDPDQRGVADPLQDRLIRQILQHGEGTMRHRR